MRGDGKAEWHFRLGRARERMRNWAAAATSYEAALARHDGKAEWHFRLGRARERLRNWAAAATSYQAALARRDSKAEWHFRLGRAHERMGNWAAAAASYQAAIARHDGNAECHFRLGRAREKMGNWEAAAASYEAALARHDGKAERPWHVCFKLALRLIKLGSDRAVIEKLLTPLLKVNDRLARQALLDKGFSAPFESTIVFERGTWPRLARKLVVKRPEFRVFFEHTRTRKDSCARVSYFYTSLKRKCGTNLPPFVPNLHHYKWEEEGQFGYFLYDFVEDSKDGRWLRDESSFNPRLATQLVNHLIRISQLNDIAEDRRRAPLINPATNILRFVEQGQSKTIDAEYSEMLSTLTDQESAHEANFGLIPLVMSHGDLHPKNIIFCQDRIFIIDWESYGLAPIAYDLVGAFHWKWHHKEFEHMVDLYFDEVAPDIENQMRRYFVALLMINWAAAHNWWRSVVPKKWLTYALKRY